MKQIALILLLVTSFTFAQVTGLAGWNLFADPGHSQTQNMGVNGYSEAESNLRTALHLQDIMLTQTDIDTVYSSRLNDEVEVSLWDRCNHANTLGAAWFHSIHSNAGAPEANNTLLLWGQLYNGQPDPPVGGEEMSSYMIVLLTDVMRIPTIGSWGDCSFYTWSTYCETSGGPYLYVNRNTNMPSELSEQGFHTNPTQDQLFMNHEYKRMLAYSFYWSVLEYHEIDRPYPGILAGIIKDAENGLAINGATVEVNGLSYTTDTYESVFHEYSSDPEELRNGYYFFEGLPDSTYDVIVSAPQFYPDTFQISMEPDFVTFLDMNLMSNIPPSVVYSEPAPGDTTYPAWDIPFFDFSRPMDETVTDAAFSITPEVTGNLWWNPTSTRLAFVPDDTLEFLTDYTIIIAGSATDVYGHPIDGDGDGVGGDDWVAEFRTGPPDQFPPVLLDHYPLDGDDAVDLRPILSLTYDEALEPASIDHDMIKFERLVNLEIVDNQLEYHQVGELSVIQLFALEDMLDSEPYRLRVFPGIEDLFGNAITDGFLVNFNSANYDYNITQIHNFESNTTSYWWDPQMSGSTSGILTEETSRSDNTSIVNHTTGSGHSMRLNYGYNTSAGSWLIRVYLGSGPPRDVTFTSSRIMQAFVFGDGQGNLFRFAVDDHYPAAAAEYHEVSPWYVVDWVGWRLVSWDMQNDGTGTWLGDGILDGTLRFDSIQLSHTPGAPNIGTYYVDDLRLATRNYLAVQDETAQLPNRFALLPNYPNPFNPITTVPFALDRSSQVRITLYDLQGRAVQTVFSGDLPAGYHETRLDASNIPSGVYLLHMSSSDQVHTRRITVVK